MLFFIHHNIFFFYLGDPVDVFIESLAFSLGPRINSQFKATAIAATYYALSEVAQVVFFLILDNIICMYSSNNNKKLLLFPNL